MNTRNRFAIALFVVAVMSIVGIAPASATTSDSQGDIGIYVQDKSGNFVQVDSALIGSAFLDLQGTPAQPATGKQTRLLGWNQWFDCYVNANSNLLLATYAWFWDGFRNDVTLRCGNDSFGYKHIATAHGSDWENKMASAVSKGWNPQQQAVNSWDDLMPLATAVTVSWPDNYVNQSGNKTCIASQVWFLRTSDHQVVDNFWVRVVFGDYTRNIITSFPQSSDYCPSA